jgi:heptosyltransferase-2
VGSGLSRIPGPDANRMTAAGAAAAASLATPSRVVVLAPNWLGDAVMALPAVADVRRHWPEARLAVAARAKLAPLFSWVPGIDEVVELDDAATLAARLSWRRDAGRLAAGRFDVAILLPNSFRTAWLIRRAGIAERWGYRRDGRGRLLTRGVGKPRGIGHQAGYYQALTAALGMTNGARAARVDPPPDGRERARALLAARGWREGTPIVGMAPGAAYGRAKRWLPERFAELALLLADAGVLAVVVGSRGDAGSGAEIQREVARRAAGRAAPDGAPLFVNLVGQTDLAALAGVMSACASFVSNDSGAMHLAAAVGLPVTAIFGASNEHRTSPLPYGGGAGGADGATAPRGKHAIVTADAWCRPCMLRECPLDHGCMAGVSARAVFERLVAHVAGGGVKRVVGRRPYSVDPRSNVECR